MDFVKITRLKASCMTLAMGVAAVQTCAAGSGENKSVPFFPFSHYSTYQRQNNPGDYSRGTYGIQSTVNNAGAKRVSLGASNINDPNDDTNLEWLNAYNAPHWVNVYKALGIRTDVKGDRTAHFADGTGKIMESYAASWTLDLLSAWKESRNSLVAQNLIPDGTRLQLNGLTDPSYGFPSHGSGGHSVGMSIDLGVGPGYINRNNQIDPASGSLALTSSGSWSIQNAIGWSAVLFNTTVNNQQDALRNFLSLYAVTQSGAANGTWSVVPVVNADRSALFGSGAQNGTQLIQNVWIGGTGNAQNPYSDINAVLGQLGFDGNGLHHARQADHHHHFHIDLRALQRVTIRENLLADESAFIYQAAEANEALIGNAWNLLDQVKTDLSLSEGEVTMFTVDMPNVPPENLPVMIAQAKQARQDDSTAMRTLGVCFPAPSDQYSGENTLSPIKSAEFYWRTYEQLTITGPATITVLQQPRHGVLRLLTEADRGTLFASSAAPVDPSALDYAYLPEKDYLGKDSATLLVDIGGRKVKIVYFLEAVQGPLGNTGWEDLCSETGLQWKVSANLDADGNSSISAVDYSSPVSDATTLDSWLRSAQLHNNLADLSGLTVTFAALTNGEVGQASGNTITLDPTAAGHGWYVDPTPLDNTDDYLPTSNPNVWQAKAGSAAAGKMDLLSVLLHEYGHALGLDHSHESGDFMAATLQPGQRRLPSAEELQLMSQLVAELKAGTSTGDQSPTNPAVPSLPLGALLLGRLALGRRPEDAVFDGSQALFAAHPTLQGGGLQNLQDWATQGKVTVASGSTGGATLQEGAASQTRLNQVFTINERDRFLSFTLAGTALDDVNGGPDDAFEVALLEADTGRSLTGALSLSHTDALLNLQANGTETAAANVTRVTNPDGSRTYRVDLAGVPAGTAVNLSFDLIGFGQAGSQVTVRDVRVSGLPELHDDTATLLEDSTLAFDPFAQVDNAALLALGSQVVDAPAHGSVSTDGTFSDTPEAAARCYP